jgi:hypothetical protein
MFARDELSLVSVTSATPDHPFRSTPYSAIHRIQLTETPESTATELSAFITNKVKRISLKWRNKCEHFFLKNNKIFDYEDKILFWLIKLRFYFVF